MNLDTVNILLMLTFAIEIYLNFSIFPPRYTTSHFYKLITLPGDYQLPDRTVIPLQRT